MLNSFKTSAKEDGSHFSIPKLGRVNLIVGKNGVGKTRLLEAIHHTVLNTNAPFIWWDRPYSVRGPDSGEYRVQRMLEYMEYASDGTLVADGIEDGIHYSIMESMWERLFSAAKTHDVQVFATTHSRDVVESFSRVASANKDIDGVLIRLGRSARGSDNGEVIATVMDVDDLSAIIAAGIEVR